VKQETLAHRWDYSTRRRETVEDTYHLILASRVASLA
jgi:hypothetical protein